MDEIEIINLHKRCNKKARRTSQLRKALKSSDEPKKVPGSSGLIDDPSEEEQRPKKASGLSNGKNTAKKAGKKVKKTSQPKKTRKSPEFIDSSEEEEEPPLLRVKEEDQGLFDLWKESKNLRTEKKVKGEVFMGEGYELSHVALYDNKYLRGVLKISDLDKKTKDLIKQALAMT